MQILNVDKWVNSMTQEEKEAEFLEWYDALVKYVCEELQDCSKCPDHSCDDATGNLTCPRRDNEEG